MRLDNQAASACRDEGPTVNLKTAVRWRSAAVPFAAAVALCGISTASAQSTGPAAAAPSALHISPGLAAVGGQHAAPRTVATRSSARVAGSAVARGPRTINAQNFPQLINDPGFESGGYGAWQGTSSVGLSNIDSGDPHSGQYNG